MVSGNGKVPVGAYVDGDMIKYTDGTSTQDIINVHDMNLLESTIMKMFVRL